MGQCSVVVQRCPHPQKVPWQILVLYNLAQGPDTAQNFPGQSISSHASKRWKLDGSCATHGSGLDPSGPQESEDLESNRSGFKSWLFDL